MIYLLICNVHYECGEGVSDWEGLFHLEGLAKRALETFDLTGGKSAYLVGLDPEALTYEHLWIRDSEQGGDVLSRDEYNDWALAKRMR